MRVRLAGRRLAAPAAQPAASGRWRTFESLRHRDFALLWVGIIIMSGGQWLQQVTLSWLLFRMTGSAFQLGLINGLRFLPFLFTSLLGGVLADRMDRKRLMLWTQAYLLLGTAVMAALLLSDQARPWHLFVFTFVSGVGWALTQPVRQAIVPTLVPKADLLNAVALTSSAFNLTRTVGPAIGGLLLVALGGGGNFLVQVGCYAVVLAMVASMRIPPIPVSAGGARVSAWGSMTEGFRYVRAHPLVRNLLILGLAPSLLGMPFASLLPIYAEDIYQIGASGLGLLLAASGLGTLGASLGVASLGSFRRRGVVQLVGLGLQGLALVVFGLVHWLPAALLVLVGAGAAQMTYNTINQTQLQTETADAMRGRVMSLYLLSVGLVPAGSFAAGAAAEVVGAPLTIAVMGASILAVALLAFVRLPSIRES